MKNYYELIKENVVTSSYDDTCVFISKEVIEELYKYEYKHIDLSSRGVIYFDEDIKDFISYIYNKKLDLYMIKEARFCDVKYKCKLKKDISVVILGNKKVNRNR